MRNTNRLESKRDSRGRALYHARDANESMLSAPQRRERTQEIAAEDLLDARVAVSTIE
jgi:hypothetical protein